ncbi:hypothetical protein SMICM17S_12263 [Streptomyces microflavus]
MQRLLEADLEREDLDAGAGAVTALLNETMPHIAIPDDFSVEEVVTVVGREVGGAVEQLVSAFTLAFTMLAQVHDSGQTTPGRCPPGPRAAGRGRRPRGRGRGPGALEPVAAASCVLRCA